MGFRRAPTQSPHDSRWRTRHRSALIECGVPDSVLESDRTLTYALLHGTDEFGTGWDPTWLTDTQATALLELLKTAIPNPSGYDIFPALERRLRQRPITGDVRALTPRRIRFYAVADDHGDFSNFAPYPIRLEGVVWPTTEHYFQAQKFLDPAVRASIRHSTSPNEAARSGRSRKLRLRSDWESAKVGVMRRAVTAKFAQYPELAAMLTATGEAELVEHTDADAFWGDGGDGTGKNMLGRILMEVRALLSAGG